MEKINEKGQTAEKGATEIREGRLKALKGKYQKAKIIHFQFKQTASSECSDMATNISTGPGSTIGCTNIPDH